VTLGAWSCNDSPAEPQLTPDVDPALDDGPPAAQQAGPNLFSDRARVFEPDQFDLVSTDADLQAGVYRFRSRDGAPLPEVARDDYVLGAPEPGADPFVRLALRTETAGDELVIETGAARWSDVIHSGLHGVTMSFAGDEPAQTLNGVTLAPLDIGPLAGVPFGPLELPVPEIDICGLVTELAATILNDPQVCGKPRDIDVAVGVVGIKLEGTLDSLVILDGKFGLVGDMDMAMHVDGGGITGGRLPTFAPCNRAAYLGCLTTPTGANFIDWLRQYAPQLPELSLRPVRVCIPGTPVRVRAGYWTWSGFVPTWTPPAFERCRISDVGVLPTIVLPAVANASQTVRPTLTGELLIKVKGDGKVALKVPIPSLGATAGYGGSHFSAKGTVGIFVAVSLALKNGGGTVKLTFTEKGEVIQSWTNDDGWNGDYEKLERKVNAQLVHFDNPDSMVIRGGVIAAISGELCAALISCDSSKSDSTSTTSPQGFYVRPGVFQPTDFVTMEPHSRSQAQAPGPQAVLGLDELAIKLKAGAEIFAGADIVWTRLQVDPADATIDNTHWDIDFLEELKLKAGLDVPLVGWALPDAIKDWDWTYEIVRLDVMDLWGTGSLRVVANTTGAAPDPDGYEVVVSRYDTLPAIIEEGADRLGKARDHGRVLTEGVGVADSVEFEQPGPCGVYYSDALVLLDPTGIAFAVTAGLQATGNDLPAWVLTSRCDLLIARYNVELTGVASNCTVNGGTLKNDVWLLQVNHSLNRQSDLQRVQFDVDCPAGGPMGDIAVTTTTTGEPPDDPYRITVDGVPGAPIGASDAYALTGLTAGDYQVGLTNLPVDCTTTPVAVTVTAGTSVPAALTVTCPVGGQDAGDLTVSSTTSGAGTDPDGFEVRVDGIARAALPLDGTAYVSNMPASVASVVEIASLAANCRSTAANPRAVAFDADANPVALPFAAECTTAAIDTIDGLVEATGWPTPTVSIRTQDGVTTQLVGPALGEIAQLTGSGIRVLGVRAGTTLDVYGYDLDSVLSDPRWRGILAQRNGEYWLFGTEAVRLVSPPSSLTARLGDLVWVSGAQTTDGIRPFVFGVLREN
jgi:hypothetical protein